jgi:hypothetical protein
MSDLDPSESQPGSRRGAGRFAAPLLLTAAGCIVLAFGPPLAPQPPFPEIKVGAREILGRELSDEMELRVAAAGEYDVILRCRCLGSSPCRIRAELRAPAGQPIVPADVVEERSATFTERPLFHRPVPLEPHGRYGLVLGEASAGVVIDSVQIRNHETGWSTSVEAEKGHLSPATLVLLDPDASGGAAVGNLASGEGVERTTQSFRAEADDLDGLFLGAVAAVTARDDVRFRLRRVSDGDVLADWRMSAAEAGSEAPYLLLRFPPIRGSRGQRFELEIEQPASHPLPLAVAEAGRYPDGELTFRGIRSTNCLLFAPRYESPWTTFGFVALGLAPLVVALGFAGRNAGRYALALLLPLVMLISVANWQREYQFKSGWEWMPDGYGAFAQHVANLIRSPSAAAFESFGSLLRQYPHAHSPVVPVLVGGLTAAGLQLPRAYLIVSFLFTVLGGWALLALLERVEAGAWPVVWTVTCLGVTHVLFLRAAVRTSTDPAGYATIVIALFLSVVLCLQPQTAGPMLTAVVLAMTVALFTRPTALPLSLAVGLAFIWQRLLGGRPAREVVPAGAVLALAPPALFFGGVLLAGLWPTFALAREKALWFASARTPGRYVGCVLILVQLLWLPLLVGLRQRTRAAGAGIRWREALLGALWLLGLLAFLVVSPAPFWYRHFLHALPGLLLIVMPFATVLHRSHPRLTRAWFWLHVGANVAFMAFTLWKGTPVDPYYVLS